MTQLYTYETFTPGTVLGEWAEPLDARLVATWERLFGAEARDQPARQVGLTVALMIRAYLNVVTPRPPGNIHAQQILSIDGLPGVGETVRSRIRCLGKEIRRERRYLQLEVSGVGERERNLYTGRMNLIWAA
ncbi:hypothetical protein [Bordetella bronchiseptica]|uniref:Uncharacterized protein n=3 Tax=Bordetella bronchiseptica TaxID=518 RepID=A0A0H3LRI2_BORBR|nr:hypothetical protein [Bordetella bronchiseptica]KAK61807.1 hypothetical protein AZ22_4808 [Bordetella bronchiseptica 980-2]KCV33255.1 hypothetical protein L489_5173 [Bordetella bronchiseptica 00-P-2730]KDD61375.1 hypothetical protein L533_5084 [Bordetella bronchiseptica OSU553]SHP69717.1 Uncharacterised protein [Mycobacteroides abscessus subsp. abscessus]AMG90651.1 hypothetical protein AL472_25130 [Bordetella bronchiseptica]